jgi:undecaprenyl diphosphate synthase
MTLATPAVEGGSNVVPTHVAIIMDGNRRWARARGLPAVAGHHQGARAVQRAIEGCTRLGVRYLTLYAFSSENWARPADEVGELMNILRFYLRREVARLDRNGVRIRVIGDRSRFAADIRELIDAAEIRTNGNRRLDVQVALNYGGRQEIVEAARRLAVKAREGTIDPEMLDEAGFARELYTADLPDPDLLIRTSGEQRISNFLLWQLAYTELVFLPVAWPEFDEQHLEQALREFARRERRYGAQPV